ncbi:2OG-FeII_Oxy domain-containing protein/DIOX_N domain-containing protein [Cephalotus follicularis]|uniref:2OG-FeII_Oxy domain-containing protein/DIOX_N domain-containing protein n=1 Tax=Cephalotus follicularis TaxID=3775 RepID=A0A1Q3CDD4_CEPFO|nr:2OG-FeII_Oxy domain-containing protein/DIOX_N domain-containing protein [Cephalotus follicularis]
MAKVPENLEWSLPVPSVQELAIQRPDTVPSRYIRDDLDHINTVDVDHHHSSIPVPLIDMTKLVNPDSQPQELQNLHSACKDWGIFQIINHGISDESLRNMRKRTQEFFELPLEEKKRWAQKPGSLEGYGQAFVISYEQKLDWNDMLFLKTLPIQARKMNFWPEQPQHFRETLESYSEDMRRVAVSLTRFMAMALKLEAEEFFKPFQEGRYETRMTCYPPCPEPERVIGMVPHSDNSGITLLLECGDMPGLQVLKDGKWVFVEPIDGAIVANTGQIIEIISNGIYKAPEHRAVVNRWKERLSIVTFCYPSSSLNVGPAKDLIKSGSPPLYKTLTHEEYMHRFYNQKFDIPFNESLKL